MRVSPQRQQLLTGNGVPHPHSPVHAAAGQAPAIGAEAGAEDGAGVPLRVSSSWPGGDVHTRTVRSNHHWPAAGHRR